MEFLKIILTFSFNQSYYEVSEDAGNVTLNVSLSGNLEMINAFLSVDTDDTNTLTTARGTYTYVIVQRRRKVLTWGRRVHDLASVNH